jgi:hypothetical protein
MKPNELRRFARFCAAALFCGVIGAAHAEVEITIINNDPPGAGFNDPTPVAPVGGNPGTTLGQQRLIAFQFAAEIWGSQLKSAVPIEVLANFLPLPCDATSAVLGAAGSLYILSDFGAGKPATWYSAALSNKLTKTDLVPELPDIRAFFNSNLGQPNCLTGIGWYLGLDNNPGTQLDLVTVLLHELAHGLGFQSFTDETNGQQAGAPDDPLPSIFDHFLRDEDAKKTWPEMTDAERALSAVTPRNLGWNGHHVKEKANKVLDRGPPDLTVTARGFKKSYLVGAAQFGPPLERDALRAQLGVVNNQAGSPGNGCTAFDTANVEAVVNRIAIIDRGGCGYTVKIRNAQDAGAVGVIIADNVAGSPPPPLGGVDPLITIPAVRVTLDDGIELKALVAAAPKPKQLPVASLSLDFGLLVGGSKGNRVLMYTPNPVEPGSSVSHWDTLATPNLLMEPFLNDDLTHAVRAPADLTLELLKDLGW